MANDPGPCSSQFKDWEEAYKEWERLDSAADKAFKNAAVKTGIALGVCGLTWWTGVGLIGCGAAAATALNEDYDSIEASSDRDDAYDSDQDAQEAYEDCVEEHKWYYGK
jgi:hypothetical protein